MFNVEIYKEVAGFDGLVNLMTMTNVTEDKAVETAKTLAAKGFTTVIVPSAEAA
jgi:hypothetical protein